MPQGMGQPGEQRHAQIHTEKGCMMVMLLTIIEGNTALEVIAGRGKCALEEIRPSNHPQPSHDGRRIMCTLR
jgi:hypothetical protein